MTDLPKNEPEASQRLPTLTGSPKQVEWAERIRQDNLDRFTRMMADSIATELVPDAVALYRKAIAVHTTARAWIDLKGPADGVSPGVFISLNAGLKRALGALSAKSQQYCPGPDVDHCANCGRRKPSGRAWWSSEGEMVCSGDCADALANGDFGDHYEQFHL